MLRRLHAFFAFALLAMLTLVGCQRAHSPTHVNGDATPRPDEGTSGSVDGGHVHDEGTDAAGSEVALDATPMPAPPSLAVRSEALAGKSAGVPHSASVASSPEGGHVRSVHGDAVIDPSREPRAPQPTPAAGLVTAGEWNDLQEWAFWTSLFRRQPADASDDTSLWSSYANAWHTSTLERIPVVVSSGGKPASDILVELQSSAGAVLWTGRTNQKGEVSVFSNVFTSGETPANVVAYQGRERVEAPVQRRNDSPIALSLRTATAPATNLDVMFMVDTTGSMGDELEYLKKELENVIERVGTQLGRAHHLRLSVNFYRDHGDEYLVRANPFDTDIQPALQALARERADGGGDTPEAVDMAMHNAILEHAWSDDARARLLFLVLDAPPHLNDDARARLETAVRAAAEKGIRVIPVMGSGYDKETEFLTRSYAILTGGTFVFLTDHSGIGGAHMAPTIGEYGVELMNDLLVRVIVHYATPAR